MSRLKKKGSSNILLLLFIMLFSTVYGNTGEINQTTLILESQISSSYADVEELNNGEIYTNSSDLELIQDRTDKQVVGLHFNNINIEKGMQIESAYIQFQVDETSDEETTLVIYGEKVANSTLFNTSIHNVSSRVKTDNSSVWSPSIWDKVGSRGEEQQTTDLKAIIQEIINQEDWIKGNSLSLIIEGIGRRVAESYDGSVSGAPKLHITYIEDSLDLAMTKIAAYADDNSNPIPTIQDYVYAGVTGVSEYNLNAVNAGVDATNAAGVDTVAKIQAIANTIYINATVQEYEITNATDDAVEYKNGEMHVMIGGVQSDGSPKDRTYITNDGKTHTRNVEYLELGYVDGYRGNQTNGLRFNNISIPKGKKILSAYIQFQTKKVSKGDSHLRIFGQKDLNSLTFSDAHHNMVVLSPYTYQRPSTENIVDWHPADWVAIGESGINQKTPDISSIINEIISQDGWENGNSLVLMIQGEEGTATRVAESYDGSVSGAPKLHITYIEDSLDLAMTKIAAYADDNSNPIPTIQDYVYAGVTGVSEYNLNAVNAGVDATNAAGVDTVAKIQAIANTIYINATVQEYEITNATDDAVEYKNGEMHVMIGGVQSDGSPKDRTYITNDGKTHTRNVEYLELGYVDGYRGNQTNGLRFNNISIPEGKKILSAYIQFQTKKVSKGDSHLRIFGQKDLNSLTFSDANHNMVVPSPYTYQRPSTENIVDWHPADWVAIGESGINQKTPDISSIINEIISQDGWENGNSLVLMIQGEEGTATRIAESYDGVQNPFTDGYKGVLKVPKLIIRYAESDVGDDKTPPVVTLNGDSSVEYEIGFYQELGATAYDDYDGTTTVVISSDLDQSSVGTYTLTYTSTNMEGLSTTVNRTVKIIPDRYLNAINGMITSTKNAREKLKNYIPKENFNYGKEFFVSPTGNDRNDGTKENPWKTLKGARDGVREYRASNALPIGGIVIWFRGGEYQSLNSLDFKVQDSGEEGSPIAYRGYQNEKVRIMGAIPIDSSWFKSVDTSDPQWHRLNNNAINHIQVLNLNEHGITNLGELGLNHYESNMPLELFDDTKSLDIARWPDREESDVIPYYTDDKVTIYGENLVPDVSGSYSKVKDLGSEDNDKNYYTYALFKKDDLVDGKQYYIKHFKAENEEVRRVWAITTGEYTKEPSFWYAGTGYSIPRDFTHKTGEVSGVPTTIPFEDIQFGFASYKKALSNKSFEYVQDRPSIWKNTGDIWVNGGFQYIWRNYHIAIDSIDIANKSISLKEVPGLGMNDIGKEIKRQYYVYNVIEELTAPGEYFVDKNTSNLYYYPKLDLSVSNLYASITDNYIVNFKGASFVEFHDMAIEMSRKDIVRFTSGSHNLLSHLQLRLSGRHLVSFDDNVTDSGVEYSYMSESGSQLVNMYGGDKETLTSGNNFVSNNEMVGPKRLQWSQPALRVGGVGNKVVHNDIHGFKYIAIIYKGNECTIAYNNIYDVMNYAEDGGAIYTGRSWTARGNKVNYNFIHDLKNNYSQQIIAGIYFDVSIQQQDVVGNIFYNLDGKGMLQSGGRYNKIIDNLFIKVATPFMGINHAIRAGSEVVQMTNWYAEHDYYKNNIWTTAYPELLNLPSDIDALKGTHWLEPEGNIFKDNFGENNLRWTLNGKTMYGTNNFEVYDTIEKTPMDRNNFRVLPYNKIGIQLP